MKTLDQKDITSDDILKLDDNESISLLDLLLQYEFQTNNLPISALTLCSDPNIPDGGIDASIDEEMPENLDFIHPGISMFQFKATSNYNARKELCIKSKKKDHPNLKPLIKEYLDEGATYVLINTKRRYTSKQKQELKKRIQEVFDKCGFKRNNEIRIYSADDITRWCSKFRYLQMKKEINQTQRAYFECINALEKILKYCFEYKENYFTNRSKIPKDTGEIIRSLEKLKSNKQLIERLGITYTQEKKKFILTRAMRTVKGKGIFIFIDCENVLKIKLKIYNYEVEGVITIELNGKDIQNYSEISNILNCLRKKIKKEVHVY